MAKMRKSKVIVDRKFKKSIPFFNFKISKDKKRVFLDKDIDSNLNTLSCDSKAKILRRVSDKLDEVGISSFSGFSNSEKIKKLSNLQQNRVEALRKYAINLSEKVNDCIPFPKGSF